MNIWAISACRYSYGKIAKEIGDCTVDDFRALSDVCNYTISEDGAPYEIMPVLNVPVEKAEKCFSCIYYFHSVNCRQTVTS